MALNFTKDQRDAYIELSSFFNSPFNETDYVRALSGPAGTGKTTLLGELLSHCKVPFSMIGLAAPSHKAKRILSQNIDGIRTNTVASDLGLKPRYADTVFDVNNPPFESGNRVKFTSYSIYIIDEASMITKSQVALILKLAKSNKIKILFVGDEFQLAPVGEYYSTAFKNSKVCRLTQVVRQSDDNPVRKLLDMLRNDIKYKRFSFLEYINTHKEETNSDGTKGFKVLGNSTFTTSIDEYFTNPILQKNIDFCKVISYTNRIVNAWNRYVRYKIIKDSAKTVISKDDLFTCYVNLVDDFNAPIVKNSEDYIVKDVINYTNCISYEGNNYLLKGYTVKFIAVFGGDETPTMFFIDHTDYNTFVNYSTLLRLSRDKGYRGHGWGDYFKIKNANLCLVDIINPNTRKTEFDKDFDYGFSLTAHKAQGSTYDNVLVDVNDIVYDQNGQPYTNADEINRRLYVACSRCRNNLVLKYGC